MAWCRRRHARHRARGQLRIVRGGKLLPTPVPGVRRARAGAGRLAGSRRASAVRHQPLIYLSYSKPSARRRTAKRAPPRCRARSSRTTAHGGEEIFEAKAWNDRARPLRARIASADGKLYIVWATAWRTVPASARRRDGPESRRPIPRRTWAATRQDPALERRRQLAKTIRSVGRQGALPEIWSYGHRIRKASRFNPITGALWETEHGRARRDEIK